MHQLAFREMYAKKASLTFRSRSKMHLEVNELHCRGSRQAVGSNPLYIYTSTNTAHRSIGACKRRQSASDILHPTQSQVAEVGMCVVEDPVLPGPAWIPTGRAQQQNQDDPWKGADKHCTPVFPWFLWGSHLPGRLKWKLQRTEGRQAGIQV